LSSDVFVDYLITDVATERENERVKEDGSERERSR
jgi:hypothetical protein